MWNLFYLSIESELNELYENIKETNQNVEKLLEGTSYIFLILIISLILLIVIHAIRAFKIAKLQDEINYLQKIVLNKNNKCDNKE